MKIAFISEQYPPTDGGVATSTQRVAQAMSALGVSVHVLCFDHSRPLDVDDYVLTEYDHSVRISRVGPFFLRHKHLSKDGSSEKLKAALRRRAYGQMLRIIESDTDVILSFYVINSGFIAQYLARTLNIPHVAGVRGDDIGRNIFNVERFAVIQWVINGADWVVSVNEHLKARMLMAFPEVRSRSCVIPNSVSPYLQSVPVERARTHVGLVTGWNHYCPNVFEMRSGKD